MNRFAENHLKPFLLQAEKTVIADKTDWKGITGGVPGVNGFKIGCRPRVGQRILIPGQDTERIYQRSSMSAGLINGKDFEINENSHVIRLPCRSRAYGPAVALSMLDEGCRLAGFKHERLFLITLSRLRRGHAVCSVNGSLRPTVLLCPRIGVRDCHGRHMASSLLALSSICGTRESVPQATNIRRPMILARTADTWRIRQLIQHGDEIVLRKANLQLTSVKRKQCLVFPNEQMHVIVRNQERAIAVTDSDLSWSDGKMRLSHSQKQKRQKEGIYDELELRSPRRWNTFIPALPVEAIGRKLDKPFEIIDLSNEGVVWEGGCRKLDDVERAIQINGKMTSTEGYSESSDGVKIGICDQDALYLVAGWSTKKPDLKKRKRSNAEVSDQLEEKPLKTRERCNRLNPDVLKESENLSIASRCSLEAPLTVIDLSNERAVCGDVQSGDELNPIYLG
jgi:hypothetical protein